MADTVQRRLCHYWVPETDEMTSCPQAHAAASCTETSNREYALTPSPADIASVTPVVASSY